MYSVDGHLARMYLAGTFVLSNIIVLFHVERVFSVSQGSDFPIPPLTSTPALILTQLFSVGA